MTTVSGAGSGAISFRVLAEIAAGATARIDLCRAVGPPRDGQLLAVKRLHAHIADDPAFANPFFDEIWMTASLRHPNVVEVAGWGRDAQGAYLAVELVQGVSLARLMKTIFETGEEFTERMVVFIASQLCRGLGAAHALRNPQGESLHLIHRDLTPGNVLVSFQGEVKITDFGLAKAKQRITQTATGLLKGQPSYMAPEQARGQPIDSRADLFALGVMLFELFSGQRPWTAASEIDVLKLSLISPPANLQEIRPKLHSELVSIVMRCLEKDPANRFQSAVQIQQKFDLWLDVHGYQDDNEEALGRFVRRNAMRQMRWFERAIAGQAVETPDSMREAVRLPLASLSEVPITTLPSAKPRADDGGAGPMHAERVAAPSCAPAAQPPSSRAPVRPTPAAGTRGAAPMRPTPAVGTRVPAPVHPTPTAGSRAQPPARATPAAGTRTVPPAHSTPSAGTRTPPPTHATPSAGTRTPPPPHSTPSAGTRSQPPPRSTPAAGTRAQAPAYTATPALGTRTPAAPTARAQTPVRPHGAGRELPDIDWGEEIPTLVQRGDLPFPKAPATWQHGSAQQSPAQQSPAQQSPAEELEDVDAGELMDEDSEEQLTLVEQHGPHSPLVEAARAAAAQAAHEPALNTGQRVLTEQMLRAQADRLAAEAARLSEQARAAAAQADQVAAEAARLSEQARSEAAQAERAAALARTMTDAASKALEAVQIAPTAGILEAGRRLAQALALEQSLSAPAEVAPNRPSSPHEGHAPSAPPPISHGIPASAPPPAPSAPPALPPASFAPSPAPWSVAEPADDNAAEDAFRARLSPTLLGLPRKTVIGLVAGAVLLIVLILILRG